MILTTEGFPRMTDITIVKSCFTEKDVYEIAEACRKYNFVCTYALNAFAPKLQELLKDVSSVKVGYSVGFPSGGETMEDKLFQTREGKRMNAGEIDCVINIGQLKSGNDAYVLEELRSIVKEAEGIPVKAIIETMILSDEEIQRATEIVMKSGAKYIKTGTGWNALPTTYHHVEVIRDTIGESKDLLIKASGGIRGLEMVTNMIKLGVSRFGMSQQYALNVMKELAEYPEGIEI